MARKKTPALEGEMYGREEAFAKLGMSLLKTEEFKVLSDLESEEIGKVAIIQTLADRLKSPVLKTFVKNFLLLRVSQNRLGRREMMNIATSGVEDTKKKAKSISSLFAGLR